MRVITHCKRLRLKSKLLPSKKNNFNRTDTFTLTTLNPLLKQVGYTNKEITFDQTHMRYCLYNAYNGSEKEKANHYMSEEFFDKLPKLLLSPIAIVLSNTMGGERQFLYLIIKLTARMCVLPHVRTVREEKVTKFSLNACVFNMCKRKSRVHTFERNTK